jgi:hypothetical protein
MLILQVYYIYTRCKAPRGYKMSLRPNNLLKKAHDVPHNRYVFQKQYTRRAHYLKGKIQPTLLTSVLPSFQRCEYRHCITKAFRKKWEHIFLNPLNCLWSCKAHIPYTRLGPVTQLPSKFADVGWNLWRALCLVLLFLKYQCKLSTRSLLKWVAQTP